jgi:hypothetical protein
MCPDWAPAVCGIKSRVDGRKRTQGSSADQRETAGNLLLPTAVDEDPGDKVGLTEIQLKCCEVK